MTGLENATLTASLTLLGGMLLFGISEFVKVLVLIPLQKFKEHVQLTLDRTDFYANRITNYFPERPSETEKQLIAQITADFRSAATGLTSTYVSISIRKPLVWFKVIPSPKEIQTAYGSLMYLSNSILYNHHGPGLGSPVENLGKIDKIKSSLVSSTNRSSRL